MYRKFLKGILPLASLLASEHMMAQEIVFQDFYHQILQWEDRGEYARALDFLKAHRSQYPDKEFLLLKEEIYLREKLSMFSENMALFKEGHDRGYFFFMHPGIRAFDPYKEMEGFDSLSATDLQLRKDANARSELLYKVVFPKNYTWKARLPICLIFHGGGSNLQRVSEHWHSPTLDGECIKVYLQSYLHYDSGTFGWRSGDERAFREITELYQQLREEYPVDTASLLVAGISAGGTFAIDLAIRQIIPVTGFMVFCPGIPAILSEGPAGDLPEVRGYMLGGEKDYYLSRQKKMMEIFDQTRLGCRHEIVEGMGHHYPVEESRWIEEAIKFIEPTHVE